MPKTLQLEIKWAFVFSIVSLLWFTIEKMLGLHDENIQKQLFFSYFFTIPAILIYFLAIADKKKNVFKGIMTWKQGVVSGVYISFFVAVFSIFINFLCLTFISPAYFENISEYVVSTKAMTAEGAKEYFNLKSYMIQGVFGALSIGVVTSAIVAFFLQTKE